MPITLILTLRLDNCLLKTGTTLNGRDGVLQTRKVMLAVDMVVMNGLR